MCWSSPRNPMHCFKHEAMEAVGVCAHCGRALCRGCVTSASATRLACSAECADALGRDEQVMQQLLRRSTQSVRASAFYCYLCGGLCAGTAVAAWFMLPVPFLIWFTAASAVAFLISGIWYSRSARK